jgi:hypothetical protein
MALNKPQLVTQLAAIYSNVDPTKTPLMVANQMADAIEAYVKSATVTSSGETLPTAPGTPAGITNLQGTIS